MTCQRPGCTNEVGPRTNAMGPTPRFCDDPECRRLRHLVCVRLYQAREKGDLPPFVRKGLRKKRRDRRASPEQRERMMGMLTQKPEIPKEKKVVDGKLSLVDREAELAGIDRGTKEGFRRYMTERPVYFQWVFPRMTIAEAWGMVGGR